MSDHAWASQLDAFATNLATESQVPGLAVAVARRGEVVYERGFGCLDSEGALPATPDSVFPIFSLTKTFTSLAVLQLEDTGKLSVDLKR